MDSNKEEDPNKKLFRLVTDRMHSALGSFHIWKFLNKAITIEEVGKEEAEKNVSILKVYWNFFGQVKISVYKSFVADLSIFFDSGKYQDKFSLGKLISVLEDKISKEELSKIKAGIDSIKRKHIKSIKLLQTLRNDDVAHQTLDPKSRLIVYSELEELFAAVQEILNLISKHYNSSITLWDHVGEGIEWHTGWVLENLERGEKLRLEEIDSQLS